MGWHYWLTSKDGLFVSRAEWRDSQEELATAPAKKATLVVSQ